MSKFRKRLVEFFCLFIVWWGAGSTFIVVTGGREGINAGAQALSIEFMAMGWFMPIALILFIFGFLSLCFGAIFFIGGGLASLINNWLDNHKEKKTTKSEKSDVYE